MALVKVPKIRRSLLMATVALPLLAVADDSLPDEAFLEYLGSWEESDEDWLAVLEELDEDKEDAKAEADEPKAPVDDETKEPEEKESGEDYDA